MTNHREIKIKLGKAIAKQRLAAGLTQEQVAVHLNIGHEAVSRIERGLVEPTVIRLFELAEIFDCEVAALLTENSTRLKDQEAVITARLATLAVADRELVLTFVDQLATRLAS